MQYPFRVDSVDVLAAKVDQHDHPDMVKYLAAGKSYINNVKYTNYKL